MKILRITPLVIIDSVHRDFTFETDYLDVSDYLLKPYSLDRFTSTLHKCIRRDDHFYYDEKIVSKKEYATASSNDTLLIKEDKTHYQIKLSDIRWIESYGQHCKLHTIKRYYLML
ncbi:MAG: hypothetical protein WBA74_00335 [Cyclobacteriaceae bacterium]